MEAFDFNPARLTLARRRRGLTKVALGHKLQLTARRLAAFENEGQTPPESTIAAIAEALDFPIGFFARETPPSVTDDVVSFRSFSRLSATNRDAALAAAALAIELAAWIDERFRLPKPQLPDVRDVEPKTAAVALRVAWGLGDAPAPNLIHLLEAHGVRVFSLTDDCADLDAFSLWSNGVSFVFLTRHKSPERGRWDAAHELGHLVLHLGSPPQGREQENEADEFAREFLLPQGGVLASAPRYASLAEIRVQKIVWRVSALAYIRRLHQLGLVSDWHYRSLAIAASEAGYRRAEGDIERESSQLISKVFAMLREDGVTAANVAADLAIPLADLRSLLFFPLSLVEGGRTGSRTSADAPRLRVL